MNKGCTATACVLLACAQGTPAQDRACPPLAFEPVPGAPAPITIEQIEGQVVASPPEAPKLVGAVSGVCLALFTDGGKQVAAGATNERGQFRFAYPGPGRFVLVGLGPPPVTIVLPLSIAVDVPGDASQRGLLVRVTVDASSRLAEAEPIGNLSLRRELFAMERADQDVRKVAIGNGVTEIAPELLRRMADIDSRNDVRLRQIVRRFGWPARPLVGVDGAEAATTLVMHMPPATQQAMLPLVESAYRAGTVAGPAYANLLDHVFVNEGKRQVFGTVAEPFKAAGEVVFKPIEDEAHVDDRRAEVGLMPLAEYRELMRRLYFPSR